MKGGIIMDIKEVRKVAKERMKGYCRVCPVCNGVACAGEVPGMGGSETGASFKSNVEDLGKIKLRLKTIHDAKDPNMKFEFWGGRARFPCTSCTYNRKCFQYGRCFDGKGIYRQRSKGG